MYREEDIRVCGGKLKEGGDGGYVGWRIGNDVKYRDDE